ncbi:sensor histidine kinase [Paenibacillus beijingensis]|uniref:sensor histidine kinase n=1 Tax=Paenibacillus beijingensis TaxID=1126833 RepID=UPI000AB5415E|nr:sensor histidine kinase [Paenibacillus beijingensis]
MQRLHKYKFIQILIVGLCTAVAGEVKITPFGAELFRIGLGAPVFLLFLLYRRSLNVVVTGIVTGAAVILYRMLLLWLNQPEAFSLLDGFRIHAAGGLYYVVYGSLFFFIKNRLNDYQPLVLGFVVAAIDCLANIAELSGRAFIYQAGYSHRSAGIMIALVAIVRSFFIIGLFSSISISRMRTIQAEQEKRMEQMLQIFAGLYGEAFYLRKSMDTIERVTANSYELYEQLKSDQLNGYGQTALRITQQFHEVKKDSQRILAGLLKLFDTEVVTEMSLKEIIHYVVKANSEYGNMLNKDVSIFKDIDVNYETSSYIPLLTVLNNLVANAIEAIKIKGFVSLKVYEKDDLTFFIVTDNGRGIAEQDAELVFEPGFTTKFNDKGIASTGIGLSHVKDIVRSFEGSIQLTTQKSGINSTEFTVSLPTNKIRKRG